MEAERWHGVTIETNLTAGEIIQREKQSLKNFFGQEVDVPPPPQELLEVMKKAKEISWTQAEGHYIPNMVMGRNSDYPGWKIRPEEWLFSRIEEGGLEEDVFTLEGNWIIIDGSQKPEYENGTQMFQNDPFVSTLTKLRESNKITKHKWTKRITNPGSRYGISYDEIQESINPAIATLLGVTPTQVRLPKAMEYNLLGNIYHPEWGNTLTWDWLQEIYEDAGPLLAGKSKNGGLAAYDCTARGHHEDNIGFRPLIVFPKAIR